MNRGGEEGERGRKNGGGERERGKGERKAEGGREVGGDPISQRVRYRMNKEDTH